MLFVFVVSEVNDYFYVKKNITWEQHLSIFTQCALPVVSFRPSYDKMLYNLQTSKYCVRLLISYRHTTYMTWLQ